VNENHRWYSKYDNGVRNYFNTGVVSLDMAYCQQCGTELTGGTQYCGDCGSEIGTNNESATGVDDHVDSEAEYNHPGENGFAVKHAIFVGLLALIPTIILAIILPGDFGAAGILGLPLFGYLGYKRPTVKSAFGRQSFWSAIMLFMSPIMMIIHTALFIGSETEGTAEEAGAAIGGTVLIVLAFLIGLPLGIAFYLLHSRYDIAD
jgi:hypothetical protein